MALIFCLQIMTSQNINIFARAFYSIRFGVIRLLSHQSGLKLDLVSSIDANKSSRNTIRNVKNAKVFQNLFAKFIFSDFF